MRSGVRLAASLLTALTLAPLAAAQDAHYWTYGYGPVGQLTEGTLVGGVSDLSAAFYNPGALALLEKPRFVVGLTSVELANIDVPGAAGEGLNVDQLVFDIVPSLLAGHIGGQDAADHFAVAFLSRHDSDGDLVAPLLRAALGRGFALPRLSSAAEPALAVARRAGGQRVARRVRRKRVRVQPRT